MTLEGNWLTEDNDISNSYTLLDVFSNIYSEIYPCLLIDL